MTIVLGLGDWGTVNSIWVAVPKGHQISVIGNSQQLTVSVSFPYPSPNLDNASPVTRQVRQSGSTSAPMF